MRIYIHYTPSEWAELERVAQSHGFRTTRNFVFQRISRAADLLPLCEGCPAERKKGVVFKIKNEDTRRRLREFARQHDLSVAVLVKRIATDPLLQHLLTSGPPASPRG